MCWEIRLPLTFWLRLPRSHPSHGVDRLVDPMMDLSRLSVMHANAVLNACLGGIAVRRAGLDPDYVHPLALDHGQR